MESRKTYIKSKKTWYKKKKKTWYKWTYLQKRKRVADLENKLTAARVGWKGMGEGVVRELGVDMYTLLYFKWIANKNSLYSTENSAQCCVTAWMVGSFRENGSMHVYGWVPLLFTWNCHNVVNWPSVQFSHSVVSDSLRPHEPQHARPPCPSPTPRVYSNSCPSSRWCHLAISSSVIPFSSCPQSYSNTKLKV